MFDKYPFFINYSGCGNNSIPDLCKFALCFHKHGIYSGYYINEYCRLDPRGKCLRHPSSYTKPKNRFYWDPFVVAYVRSWWTICDWCISTRIILISLRFGNSSFFLWRTKFYFGRFSNAKTWSLKILCILNIFFEN